MSAVSVEDRDGTAVVTIDRPPANAFEPELVSRMRAALRQSAGARSLVLASANPKLFSAGWDLPRVAAFGRPQMEEYVVGFCDLVREIFAFSAPVLAALSGHAIAGGLIVASAADERYASDGQARFGLSEVSLGVPLPACCLEVFRYVIGARGTERLAASAENMPAERALSIGLLDRVVPGADLLEATLARARLLARCAAPAYAEIKRRGRAEALARFDAARKDDPFLDFWFGADARQRIAALVGKLTAPKDRRIG